MKKADTVFSLRAAMHIILFILLFSAYAQAENAPEKLVKIHIKTDYQQLHIGESIELRAVGEYSDASQKDITDSVKWISEPAKVGRFIDHGVLYGESIGNVKVFVRKGAIKSPGIRVRIFPSRGPVLEVKTPEVDIGNVEMNKNHEFTVSIRNSGKKELRWDVITDQPWLIPLDSISLEQHKRKLGTVNDGLLASIGTGNFKLISPSLFKEKSEVYAVEETGTGHDETVLAARRNEELTFITYTRDLPEGEYSGSILIRSNGGDKKVNVSMKIVSLKAISISPVAMTIRAGQRRTFKATGLWSDGSKTDLSSHEDGQWITSDHSVGTFIYKKPVFIAKQAGTVEIRKTRGPLVSDTAVVNVKEFITVPVFAVSPREIDLGAVGPGENSRGIISLKNVGSRSLSWSSEGPEGWSYAHDEKFAGSIDKSPRYIRISLESLKDAEVPSDSERYPIALRIETMQDTVTYKKTLQPGKYRERMVLHSNGGIRHIFFTFEVAKVASRPHIALDPMGIDLGVVEPGKRLLKKIKLHNTGKDVLTWKAILQEKKKKFNGIPLKRGRYISLRNEKTYNKEIYDVPEHLKESIFISGKWFEEKGYPYSNGYDNSLTATFLGTGIFVFLWKDVEGGIINAYVDDQLVGTINCRSEQKKRAEFSIAEDLPEGPHVLTLVCEQGNVVIEGLRIYGESLLTGGKGWIRLNPGIGTTTKETDYVNVLINTKDLKPGQYSENILFTSNGGNEIVEVSLKISDIKYSELITVYRYSKNLDYLYTTKPSAEDPSLLSHYNNDGIYFKLFRTGTHGTTEFYRWYNPSKGDHFYSYDRNGGGKSLQGYEYEGSIGNIATSRLIDTKELYRWFNPVTGTHYYSTDLKGEEMEKKGYRYDGIAGYVR